MLNIVLYEPEIPFNTGAAIRLCANTGFSLHLIKPLGFDFNDKKLRRAGLDYHEFAQVELYESYPCYQAAFPDSTIYACTTKAYVKHTECCFQANDSLLFGPETRGLPDEILNTIAIQQQLRIPMQANSRSINLANAVAIVSYEAWRQLDFVGAQ